MTTNVPPIQINANGVVVPSASSVLTGVQADFNAAFGASLNFGTTGGSSTNATPQGQLAASLAAIIAQINNIFLFQSTQTDPSFATGRWQDAIGRIYFMYRLPAIPTSLNCSCQGLTGTTIPLNAQIQDPTGNVYAATGSGAIGVNGTVGINFAAQIPGPIQIPASISILQAIPGWDSVTLLNGIQGQNTESSQAFETRRQQSVAQNSQGALTSIIGAVLNVPGVVDAYVTQNTNASPTVIGGVSLIGNSVYVAVVGGAYPAVAQAIWSKKSPGCNYAVDGASSTVTQTVFDTQSGYSPPFPSYSVSFVDATKNALPVLFSVNIVNSVQVPSNATQLIQNAIVAAFAGSFPGTPRARIGSTILASNYVAPIAALGSWALIRSIQLGSPNSPTATITGSINGSVLTVSAASSNSIASGATVSGSVGGSVVVLPGTTIINQLTGTPGGIGTYTVANSQSTPSQSGMTVVTPTLGTVSVNINQEPTIAAGNIAVIVT